MALGIFDHPAATTRARAIKALLLRPQDWQALAHATDLPDALRVLGTTAYRGVLDKAATHTGAPASMRTIEHALRLSTIEAMQKLLRFLHGGSRSVPEMLIQRYDLLNIKKTLRRLSQPERHECRLAIANYELGPGALLKDVRWDGLGTPQDLGKVLETTYYRQAYRMGLAAFSDAHDLLMFESTLEKAYHDELATRAQALGAGDHAQICALLGSYFDEMCLAAFTRFKYHNNLDASAIYALLPLDACVRMRAQVFWQLASTTDEAACIAALAAHKGWSHVAGATLRETYVNLRRERLQLCRRTFIRSSSVSLAPVIAYYFLKDIEVKDIMAVLHCKRFNVPVPQDTCVHVEVQAVA